MRELQSTSQRIDDIDYLRGFALMGILLVNIPVLSWAVFPKPGSVSAWISQFFSYFVLQSVQVTFPFLFGVSFFLFMSQAEAKGQRGHILFIRRLLALLVFGAIHQWFYRGEALLLYAIIGFLLLPFYRLRPTILLGVTLIVTALGILLSPYVDILAMFLLGLFVGKIGLFVKRELYQPQLRFIWLGSLLLAIPALFLQSFLFATDFFEIPARAAGVFLATFYVTTFLFALHQPWIRTCLFPLKAYGRMTLTNYVGQTVIILTIVHIFHLLNKLDYVQTTLI